MRYALDASFFFSELALDGDLVTTPSVVEELADIRSRCRLEALLATGLLVVPPTGGSLERIAGAGRKTGDSARLSPADTDLLALAVDLGAEVVTDDYAVQNVALALGLGVRGILQRKARPRKWKYRCPGCNRRYPEPGTCPECGTPLSRTLK
ncbi:MAG TPA: NOB1 family endonuclease [Methanomicrobiales archaeon]|nr:NOB1 family endonuclease [Methanomicrobiales archaeon]